MYGKPLLLICIVILYPLYAFLHIRPNNFSDMGWPAWPRMVYGREYWILYRGPGFLAVKWFCSSPIRLRTIDNLLTGEEEGLGGANSYDDAKALSSLNHSILSVWRSCLSFPFIRFPPPHPLNLPHSPPPHPPPPSFSPSSPLSPSSPSLSPSPLQPALLPPEMPRPT